LFLILFSSLASAGQLLRSLNPADHELHFCKANTRYLTFSFFWHFKAMLATVYLQLKECYFTDGSFVIWNV